jgi:hypothetical protein
MHAALDDGVFDTKEFGDFGFHGHFLFAFMRCGGLAAGPSDYDGT